MAQYHFWINLDLQMGRNKYHRQFDRRVGKRKPKQSVLIVCEGDKTEPNYFKRLGEKLGILGRNSVEVEIDIEPSNHASAPRSVVTKANDLKKQRAESESQIVREYDKVYCVIDVEIPQHATLKEAIEMARQAGGIDVILSNPCFEYWLRLHYGHTGSSYNCNNAVWKDLKRFCKGYDKGIVKDEWFCTDKINSAIRNAKNVLKQHGVNADLVTCNPATDVHKVVEHMQEMSKINSRK
jgi:hypothetical protein